MKQGSDDGGAWTRVVSAASALAERAGKLFARSSAGSTTAVPAPSSAEALSAVEIRTIALEKRVAALTEEAVASFEVVRAITEQHSQIVQAVDTLRERAQFLGRACLALAFGLAVVAVVAAIGWLR